MAFPVRATYRLQLRGESSGFGFTFADAEKLLDYLDDLGISHLYLSPVMTAVRGSSHGYDVTDPTTVSPELGGADGLARELTLFFCRRADNRSDRQHPEKRSIRTTEREHDCIGSSRGNTLDDRAHSAGCSQAAIRIEQPVEGVHDRLRVECSAVVKAYAFA